jgi:hypothetical protein
VPSSDPVPADAQHRPPIVPAGDFLKFEPTRLVVADALPLDQWESALETLVPIQRSSPWWVGDLLAFGEKKYGSTYDPALKATGFRLQTLKNLAWVARAVPAETRREDLSWSAHRAVAILDQSDQAEWLDRAAAEEWTSRELAAQLRRQAKRDERDDDGGAEDEDDGENGSGDDFPDPERKRLCKCPQCGHEWEEPC